MCSRFSYISAIIVGCITKKVEAAMAIAALGELFIDCEICCEEGWGSENCCGDIKWFLNKVCKQDLLDGL